MSELRRFLRLAGPVVLAEIGWMSMGLVDTLMVGRLGPAAIGATGMGSGVFTAIVIFGMGEGASFGMIQAIEEHNAQEGATKAWFIDVIGDKKAEHGDVLLSSVLFDYTGIYKQMLDDLNAALKEVGTVQFPANVELVTKYYDKLDAALQ